MQAITRLDYSRESTTEQVTTKTNLFYKHESTASDVSDIVQN